MNQIKLKLIAEECVTKIHVGDFFCSPYKHLVVDNFLPTELAKECLQSFPDIDDNVWEHEIDTDIEIKSRTRWESEFDIPSNIIDAVRILNSSLILKAFSEVFTIPKLLSDSYFTGGGLNITSRGGLLDVHVDGNYHDATGLNRRMNAIIYLNPGWDESWGGEFGLYNHDGTELIKKVAPIFNRLVVFDSHDYSYHGLPDELNFPKEIDRKSIILYYYTKDTRPLAQTNISKPHSALWVKRELKDKKGQTEREFK
ncbi:MAG: 2OG-Fe(II) oxygenase [Oceanospirillaceae bacterium]